MTITLAGKSYKFKDLNILRNRVPAGKASDAFGKAIVKYFEAAEKEMDGKETEEHVAECLMEADTTFKAFCNSALKPKLFGLVKFNQSILDVPMPEVNALRAAFFELVNPTKS